MTEEIDKAEIRRPELPVLTDGVVLLRSPGDSDVAAVMNYGLEIRTDKRNLASQRVAEKAGFTRIGVVRTIVPSTGEEYEDGIYRLASSP